MLNWEVWVAIYAAIVATGALFLEVRRWVEGKARLHLNVMQNARAVNVPGTEENTYLHVTVVNRGAMPTTITHMTFQEFPTFIARLRRKPSKAAFVANPNLPGTGEGQLPYELSPGARWGGAALQSEELNVWIAGGRLYLGIHASHSDRPTFVRLRRDRAIPKGAKEL